MLNVPAQPDKTTRSNNLNDEEVASVSSNATGIASVTSSVVSGLKTSLGQWKIIGFGQIMAILMAARGCASTLLYIECRVMAPAFVLSFVYFFLMVIYLSALVIKQKKEWKLEQERRDEGMTVQVDDHGFNPTLGKYKLPGTSIRLHVPWYKYMIMALCEVEANYATLTALKYTSVKSATLLDTVGIPTAMLASYIMLSRRYAMNHLLGASICVLGATITVFSDYESTQTEKHNKYPFAVFGDVMAALGGMLYGITDVFIEEQVKLSGRTEFIAMLGLFGTVLCAVQGLFLEMPLIGEMLNPSSCSSTASFWINLFVITTFYAYYVSLSKFLIVSEAAFLNLSLLTSDMWSVGFSIVQEHEIPTSLFLASMCLIMSGVLVYESVPSPMGKYPLGSKNDSADPGDIAMTKTGASGKDRSTTSEQKIVELPPSFSLS